VYLESESRKPVFPKFSIPTQPTKIHKKVFLKALKPFRITQNNTKMPRESLFVLSPSPTIISWKMNLACFSSLLNVFTEEAALFTQVD